MSRLSITDTRWFSLSGRELLLLAVGVGVVLTAVGLVEGIEAFWGRKAVTVTEAADLLPLPARLNINASQEPELAMLPGVGPKTAGAIVEHRRLHGPFTSLEDLMEVRGIGPKTVERIRPHAMCAPVEAGAGGD